MALFLAESSSQCYRIYLFTGWSLVQVIVLIITHLDVFMFLFMLNMLEMNDIDFVIEVNYRLYFGQKKKLLFTKRVPVWIIFIWIIIFILALFCDRDHSVTIDFVTFVFTAFLSFLLLLKNFK